MTLYVIMGYSDAGKDTVAGLLGHDVINIKWSRPMKTMLENVYGIRPGSLDDKEFRKTLVPGHPDGIDWAELMIRCFHHFPMIDPHMMTQNVVRQLRGALEAGYDIALTDTRNFAELAVIEEYLNAAKVPLVAIWVHRPGVYPKASDLQQGHIFSQLAGQLDPDSIHTIINDGSLDKLRHKVTSICQPLVIA